jgi:photosystem II stability/assembly factor-like uncharacterized protein
MQCDPHDENRIFINNYGGGNFLSTDGGSTWEVASKGYSGAFIKMLAVARDNPSLVYAAGRVGLFVSTDGGQNWSGLAFGDAHEPEAQVIAVDPFDSKHILTVVGDSSPNPLISYDSGMTWKKTSTGVTSPVSRMVFSPTEKNLVFASAGKPVICQDEGCIDAGHGILISKDGGETWNKTSLTVGNISAITVYPKDASKLYASLYSGEVYKSTDSGQTWQLVKQDIIPSSGDPSASPMLTALAVDSANHNKLYAGTTSGVLISQDGGSTWSISASGLPLEIMVWDIEVDQKNQNVVYVSSENAGVFLSKDGGSTWTQLNTGLAYRLARPLALSSDGSVLYLGTWGNGVWRLGTPVSQ